MIRYTPGNVLGRRLSALPAGNGSVAAPRLHGHPRPQMGAAFDPLTSGIASFILDGTGIFVGLYAGPKLKGIPQVASYGLVLLSALRLISRIGSLKGDV